MKVYSWNNKKQILLSTIVLLVIWEILAIKINKDIYLPRIEDVILSMVNIIKEPNFFKNSLSSLYRTLISFSSALILSIVLGVLSYMYPFFKNLLKPFNAIGKTIPTMILILLALIWFNKDKAPFIVGFAIVFPILYEGIYNALEDIDKKILDMCKVYKVSKKEKIKRIYIPVIKFYVMSILISTFSLAFKVVIAGEVHGQPKYGIGTSVQIEKINFNTVGIFAWIVIIALISILFEYINKKLLKRVYRWKNENSN